MKDQIRREQLESVEFSDIASGERLAPVTPGEVLRLEFMEPLGLSASSLGSEVGVPGSKITSILNGRRSVTADLALKLAARFKTSPEFWMNLQTAHDLELARARINPAA